MSDYTPTTKTVLAYIRGYAVMAGATANEAQDAAVGWLASVERAAAEKAVANVRSEIRQIPRWWDSDLRYGEFDLQPLGPNETSEKGAYMEVMRVLDECAESYRREEDE